MQPAANRASWTTSIILSAILFGPAVGKVIYVDSKASGFGDGTSWKNAYLHLQRALADANLVDEPSEIRVAQGIYRPNQGISQIADERLATFQLVDGVTLIGGYWQINQGDEKPRFFEWRI